MDIYLPADFHQLHHNAPDDWRDVSTASRRESLALHDSERCTDLIDPKNRCADPLWRVF